MAGPKLPEYPKPLYKSDQDPIYANNPKHEDELIEQGWSERYVYRAYPRAIYAADGSVTVAKTQKEADDLVGQGWSLTAIPAGGDPSEPEPGTPEIVSGNTTIDTFPEDEPARPRRGRKPIEE